MCGIAGVAWSGETEEDLRSRVLRMTDVVEHRGPDHRGLWLDAVSGVGLGHGRLSIVDCSPRGHQPMISASGRFVITYNGETYNCNRLRKELEEEFGISFRGHSDTEVVVEGIEHWGLEPTLKRCVGMFAFALWDRRDHRLHLVRDRLGIKPLYYGWFGSALAFGSDPSVFLAVYRSRLHLDRQAISTYLGLGYIPAPASVFTEVRKLEAGSVLTATAGDAPGIPRRFWSVDGALEEAGRSPFTGSTPEAVATLSDLIQDAVRLRLLSDVPVGALLSGGIDSTLVATMMQRASSDPVRTFSIGFEDAGFDECEDAARIAAHLGTQHETLRVSGSEAMAVVPELAGAYAEPFADASQIPSLILSRLVRSRVKVALSGDGGDETFAGYSRYLWTPRMLAAVKQVPPPLRRMVAAGLDRIPPASWDRIYAGLEPMVPRKRRVRFPGEKVGKFVRLLELADQVDPRAGVTGHWTRPPMSEGPKPEGPREPGPPGLDPVQGMMILDLQRYLPDDILVKVDRASMSVGLEVRVPLVDHRIVEFGLRLPMDLKVRDGQGKWILREVLRDLVPPELWERPKTGFAVPLRDWLRGDLREWAGDLLAPERIRAGGVFEASAVTRAWTEHLTGRWDREKEVWDILMFEAWRERHFA